MATVSNNDIATAIYFDLKDKEASEMPAALKHVVRFLSRKKLLSRSGAILQSLEKILNKEQGRLVAHITTSSALTNESKESLTQTLTKRYQASIVELKEKTDARLLGGFKMQIDDEVVDLTLKNKIKKLEEHLTR